MIDAHALFNLRRLIVIGVVAYLVFALLSFPARLALRWFGPEDLSAAAVAGTLWSGQADRIVLPQATLADTAWEIRPLALLTGRLSYDIDTKIGNGAIRTIVSVSPFGSVRMKNLAGVLPVDAFGGLGIPIAAYDGRIGLDLAKLEIEDNWITDASGTVDIVSLELISPVRETLGSYAIVFDGAADDLLEGRFSEVDGPLQATGTVVLRPGRQWALSGDVKAKPGASAQLTRGLSMLGQRNSDGSYPISFSSE